MSAGPVAATSARSGLASRIKSWMYSEFLWTDPGRRGEEPWKICILQLLELTACAPSVTAPARSWKVGRRRKPYEYLPEGVPSSPGRSLRQMRSDHHEPRTDEHNLWKSNLDWVLPWHPAMRAATRRLDRMPELRVGLGPFKSLCQVRQLRLDICGQADCRQVSADRVVVPCRGLARPCPSYPRARSDGLGRGSQTSLAPSSRTRCICAATGDRGRAVTTNAALGN